MDENSRIEQDVTETQRGMSVPVAPLPVLTKRPWSVVAQRAAAIGMGLSVVLHAVLLSIAALVLAGGGGGTGGMPGSAQPIEVAVIDESQLQSLNEGPQTTEAPGIEELKNNLDLAPMPVLDTPGGDALKDAGDIGGNAGTGLGGSGAGTGIGVGDGVGGSGAGGTSFFGVEARGSRFAFIVDVSGSMEGDKLATLKRELTGAIMKLPDNAQVIVLPFESELRTFFGAGKYVVANQANKRKVLAEVEIIQAGGGTEPFVGFLSALNIRPRPDAIYFMTDGQFATDVPDKVRGLLRAGRNVPIHCITFIDESSAEMMRKIAAMSDGTYTHIDDARRKP